MILVVDGDIQAGTSLERVLKYRDMPTVFVQDGMEALSLLEMQTPALVITELDIRGIDGLMFIRAIRKDSKFNQMPIVALTADFADESRRAAFAAGAEEYIVKGTIGRDSLVERIRRLLNPPKPL